MNTSVPIEAANRLWEKLENDIVELIRLRKVALSLRDDRSSSSHNTGRSAGSHSDPTAQAALRNVSGGSLSQSITYVDGHSLDLHDSVNRLINTLGRAIDRWDDQ